MSLVTGRASLGVILILVIKNLILIINLIISLILIAAVLVLIIAAVIKRGGFNAALILEITFISLETASIILALEAASTLILKAASVSVEVSVALGGLASYYAFLFFNLL